MEAHTCGHHTQIDKPALRECLLMTDWTCSGASAALGGLQAPPGHCIGTRVYSTSAAFVCLQCGISVSTVRR